MKYATRIFYAVQVTSRKRATKPNHWTTLVEFPEAWCDAETATKEAKRRWESRPDRWVAIRVAVMSESVILSPVTVQAVEEVKYERIDKLKASKSWPQR